MLELSTEQLFKLANSIMLDTWPKTIVLSEQPFYIQAEWMHEAQKAVYGYNMVMKFMDSEGLGTDDR